MIYAKILFLYNIMETNGQNFTKYYICIHIANINVGIVTHRFLHICTSLRVMALELLQNFVSAKYLENKWTDFDQTLYNYYTDKIYVGIVNCHFSHICSSVMACDLRQNFVSVQYLENKWTEFHRISPNFIYAFILTRSTLVLLHIIFHTFVQELWPLIYSKNWFPINILRKNGQILTKLYINIFPDKIYNGIVSCHFSQISKRVWALD